MQNPNRNQSPGNQSGQNKPGHGNQDRQAPGQKQGDSSKSGQGSPQKDQQQSGQKSPDHSESHSNK